MSMMAIAQDIVKCRKEKGFYTPDTISSEDYNADLMLGKLMLVVTEVAEAAEAVRKGDLENFKEELADTLIRVLDICGTMGIDPEEIIVKKMLVNVDRPIRHNKKTSI